MVLFYIFANVRELVHFQLKTENIQYYFNDVKLQKYVRTLIQFIENLKNPPDFKNLEDLSSKPENED